MIRLFFRLVLATVLVAGLAACQSSEERAEEHYQSALALLAEGDLERATIEFRNVFEMNPRHQDARRSFAAALREAGRTENAYGQYLRLIEQYPDDIEARIALAEMASESQNWDELERHGSRAIAQAPEGDPRIAIIAANLDYAAAIEAEDASARRDVRDRAAALLADAPGNMTLRRIVIDAALRDSELDSALAEIDAALETAPELRELYNTRLMVLAQLERADEVEALLEEMIDRFPEDGELVGTLLRYHVSRGNIERATEFLRERETAAADQEERDEIRGTLLQLLLQTEGSDAALAEIDRLLASGEESLTLRGQRAAILFETGAPGTREQAIADLEAVLEQAEPGIVTQRMQVVLARMLQETGNVVGARRLIETVLEADATQTDALKMKAAWLTDEDDADAAIALLRTALDAAPDDPEALTLMAEAHARNGNHDLSREFLALAYEASNAAPRETVRYARRLMTDERLLAAEEVLISALRLAPQNLEILSLLGDLYIEMEDWPRAEGVERALRETGGEPGLRTANGLAAARLAAQGRTEDAIAFLEDLAGTEDDSAMAAQIAVIRARMVAGQGDAALEAARALVAEAPENLAARLTLAVTLASVGNLAEAEATYRDIIADAPQWEIAWVELVRVLYAQGNLEAAETTIEEGLAVLPEGLNLLWADASFAEQRGDYETAIARYEQMYVTAAGSPVVANNLASLLSTYRDDAESLERAYTIARRLRDIEVPAFQDTYGWIAYRRGDYSLALEHLEPAATALSGDPLVQFHLGMTYLALERPVDALETLQRAVELAGPEDERAQFARAREEIARLEAATPEGQ